MTMLTEMKYKHRKLKANFDTVDTRPTSQWLYFTRHTDTDTDTENF